MCVCGGGGGLTTAAVGTHPTGMHSRYVVKVSQKFH